MAALAGPGGKDGPGLFADDRWRAVPWDVGRLPGLSADDRWRAVPWDVGRLPGLSADDR
ncbi:hypothetical protein [Streptomyces sp. NPDC058434]|uniref:hypothetical protein n=1 Tax=Streptomyces sp. NPDC058434 TaxID=3346498 RepID=UPI003664DA26